MIDWMEKYNKINFISDDKKFFKIGEKSDYITFYVQNIEDQLFAECENIKVRYLHSKYILPFPKTVLCTDNYSIFLSQLINPTFINKLHKTDKTKFIVIIKSVIYNDDNNDNYSEKFLILINKFYKIEKIYSYNDFKYTEVQQFSNTSILNLVMTFMRKINNEGITKRVYVYDANKKIYPAPELSYDELYPHKYEKRFIKIDTTVNKTIIVNKPHQPTGKKRARHLVHGYLRKCPKSGGYAYIPAHYRGDPNVGEIEKEYEIK